MTLIIPYRNRPQHLASFIDHMSVAAPELDLVVVEQAEGKDFNRGKLINVGYLETLPDYLIAHDVDMIPIDVDYSPRNGITQLASSDIQPVDYLGGVTMYDADTFKRLGGYHNDYFHRAEDNELMFQSRRMGIPIHNRFGTFVVLPHPRTGPEFIPHLWVKAQQPRKVNMLTTCEYSVISRTINENLTRIVVDI